MPPPLPVAGLAGDDAGGGGDDGDGGPVDWAEGGGYEELKPLIAVHHSYRPTPGRRQCSSLLAQRVDAPHSAV